MIIVVTGGRRDKMSNLQSDVFDGMLEQMNMARMAVTVRHGGATGIDTEVAKAVELANLEHVRIEPFPVENWRSNGQIDYSLGPRRNKAMLVGADLLVAFHGGNGTANCMRQAREMGVPVLDLSVLKGL